MADADKSKTGLKLPGDDVPAPGGEQGKNEFAIAETAGDADDGQAIAVNGARASGVTSVAIGSGSATVASASATFTRCCCMALARTQFLLDSSASWSCCLALPASLAC